MDGSRGVAAHPITSRSSPHRHEQVSGPRERGVVVHLGGPTGVDVATGTQSTLAVVTISVPYTPPPRISNEIGSTGRGGVVLGMGTDSV